MYVSLCVCARVCMWLNVSVHLYFSVLIWLCSQMTVPLYNMTLKCAKCGVISSADVSTTATSNAMLVPLIIYQLFDALPSVLFFFFCIFLTSPFFFLFWFSPPFISLTLLLLLSCYVKSDQQRQNFYVVAMLNHADAIEAHPEALLCVCVSVQACLTRQFLARDYHNHNFCQSSIVLVIRHFYLDIWQTFSSKTTFSAFSLCIAWDSNPWLWCC